ncbi:MAG TPA: hypothetical protein VND87_15520 [Stellaceae bacterium]|nr:hypothetical protein [Stellaceae bacterium]
MARLALAGAAGVAALVVAAIAVWFLGQSLTLALEAIPLSPAVSTLTVGLIGLLLAMLIALVGRIVAAPRHPAPTPASPATGVADVAAELGGLLAQRLTASSRSHPYGTIGTAVVAGLIVGALPELRSLLASLLKK